MAALYQPLLRAPSSSPEEGRTDELSDLSRSGWGRSQATQNCSLQRALATVDSSPAFAVADARRVAQLTPDNPWQLCRVAEVAYHLGGHEEAEVHVRRAAELVPPSFLTRQRFVHLYGLLTWNRHAIQRRRPEHRILEAALSAATP